MAYADQNEKDHAALAERRTVGKGPGSGRHLIWRPSPGILGHPRGVPSSRSMSLSEEAFTLLVNTGCPGLRMQGAR